MLCLLCVKRIPGAALTLPSHLCEGPIHQRKALLLHSLQWTHGSFLQDRFWSPFMNWVVGILKVKRDLCYGIAWSRGKSIVLGNRGISISSVILGEHWNWIKYSGPQFPCLWNMTENISKDWNISSRCFIVLALTLTYDSLS